MNKNTTKNHGGPRPRAEYDNASSRRHGTTVTQHYYRTPQTLKITNATESIALAADTQEAEVTEQNQVRGVHGTRSRDPPASYAHQSESR